MRPKSLQEVAVLAAGGDLFDRCLANLLDEFYSNPKADALLEVPPLLASVGGDLGRVQDAYLAATAEELARRQSYPSAAWVHGEDRRLHRPWFASPLAALRAVLLLESPPAFRARNLFVSDNALSRAWVEGMLGSDSDDHSSQANHDLRHPEDSPEQAGVAQGPCGVAHRGKAATAGRAARTSTGLA